MTSVAVIGAGEVGAAVAQALATRDRVSRVLLVDDAANVAAGKALDIQQSGAVIGFHTRLEGTADLTRVVGAAVCVIADRHGQPPAEWAGDEGLALLRKLLPCTGDAPLVFAGPSQMGLMQTASRELHIARARLLGTSPEAFASAIRSMIALEAGCSPVEVVLAVLGVPPRGLVVPWSEAAIGGFALERVLTPAQMVRLESRLARLWPPGPYALGLAAAVAAEAVTTASRRRLNVLTVLHGQFGVRDRVGALPALLDARGVAHAHAPSLSTRERVLLETALGV
jgi:malate dehydrogenase